jgi:hypothetical protein
LAQCAACLTAFDTGKTRRCVVYGVLNEEFGEVTSMTATCRAGIEIDIKNEASLVAIKAKYPINVLHHT